MTPSFKKKREAEAANATLQVGGGPGRERQRDPPLPYRLPRCTQSLASCQPARLPAPRPHPSFICTCCPPPPPPLPLQVTGAVGWRKEGLRYKKNEVFLDVVETVSMLMSAQVQRYSRGGGGGGTDCNLWSGLRSVCGCAASRPPSLSTSADAPPPCPALAAPPPLPAPPPPLPLLQGSVLRCDVQGRLVMKAFLSGMPDIKLGLNDKLEVGPVGGGRLAVVQCLGLS